jgi:integrase
MTKRLTEKAVERLGIKRQHYVVWDQAATGLGIKITPKGKRIWCLQLRYPGREMQTTRTLGRFPIMGVEAARAKARQWYGWAKAGIDPDEAEAEERAKIDLARRAEALKKAHTFASVAERYIAEHLAGQRRAKAAAREIRTDLVKEWAHRPIASITPGDVKALIAKIKIRAPYEARAAFGHARTLFQWAVHHDVVQVSPVASLKQKWLFEGAKIGPRQRTLDDAEIAALWRASGRLGYPYGPLYRMLLLTGCRLNEVAKARWSEFHFELRRAIREAQNNNASVDWAAIPDSAKIWTIPAARFKSDAEHLVPLSNDVCSILETLPRFASCDYLFTTTGKIPIFGPGKSKDRLDDRMLRALRAMARQRGEDPAQVKLEPWINHDLRRVVRTNLSAINIEDHIAEMVLGHGRKGLQRVYDQHRYEPQMREALERWASRLRQIVAPASSPPPGAVTNNVVALHGRAGR